MTEETQIISLTKENAVLMFNIINACAKRGAFQAEEFKIVGTLHEFLKKELKIEDPKPPEPETPPAQPVKELNEP